MTTRPEKDWINTYMGKKFWPCDPHVDEIDIHDIAHALSMQCRFTGHVHRFYSVAEHSIRVSWKSDPKDQLWGLLHDAAEAYLIDLARPVKHQPGMAAYRDAEHKIMLAVRERFGLEGEQPVSVTLADHRMLITESHQLMNRHPDWFVNWPKLGEPYSDVRIAAWSPRNAERLFLNQFEMLRERAINAAA